MDAGVFELTPTAIGEAATLEIPLQAGDDEDETLESATATGSEASAFTVLTALPIPLPAGGSATLEVQLKPTVAGSSSATLDLTTEGMGVRTLLVEGAGVADAGF